MCAPVGMDLGFDDDRAFDLCVSGLRCVLRIDLGAHLRGGDARVSDVEQFGILLRCDGSCARNTAHDAAYHTTLDSARNAAYGAHAAGDDTTLYPTGDVSDHASNNAAGRTALCNENGFDRFQWKGPNGNRARNGQAESNAREGKEQ